MGELHLQGYTVNGQQTAKNNNYYANNFDAVKKTTADTNDILGEKVIFEISDKYEISGKLIFLSQLLTAWTDIPNFSAIIF